MKYMLNTLSIALLLLSAIASARSFYTPDNTLTIQCDSSIACDGASGMCNDNFTINGKSYGFTTEDYNGAIGSQQFSSMSADFAAPAAGEAVVHCNYDNDHIKSLSVVQNVTNKCDPINCKTNNNVITCQCMTGALLKNLH